MNLAIIGTGNMGRAIVVGLVRKKVFKPEEIIGADKIEEAKNSFLAIEKGLRWGGGDLELVCREADVIFISVKPQQLAEVLPRLVVKEKKHLYLSIAAGVPLAKLESFLGKDAKIVRAMPNTPALLGQGVTAFAGNLSVDDKDLQLAEKVFASVGSCYRVPEEMLDAVTALSGSGPAYFYLFIDCLREAAEACGLDPKISLEMASKTALGAAEMLLTTGKSPEELITQVRSKGGTTEAALKSFEDSKFDLVCQRAVDAAWKRASELARFS